MKRTLNLIIDGRPLVGNRTGIGVHTAEIAGRIDFEPPPLIASHRRIAEVSSIEHCRFRVDEASLGLIWQQRLLARIASEEAADVLWGPHGTIPLSLGIPAVITVHDLTSIAMPHRHRLKTVLSFNLFIGRSLANATAIAAVSQATTDELTRGFAVPAGKIEIIPNGVSSFFSPPGDDEPPALPFDLTPRAYVLFVGTLEPRKGLGELLTAWERLPTPRPPLVLCGDLGWRNRQILRRVEHHPDRASIIVTGFLDRRQLREMLRWAAVFVYPSHWEGFGLPPLEAMASGSPVIVTAGGALPEVVGDAAVIVPPRDAEALARALGELLVNRSRQDELRQRGIERAKAFDWTKSAALMTELLARAAGSKRLG